MADDGDVTVDELSADVAAVVGTGVPGAVAAADDDDGGATADVGTDEAPLTGDTDPAGDDDEPHPAKTLPTSASITSVACGRRATGHRRSHVLAGTEFTAGSR